MYTYEHICVYRALLSSKEEWSPIIYKKIDKPRDHAIKQNKPDPERQISHDFSHVYI